jgi:hypothetical protein
MMFSWVTDTVKSHPRWLAFCRRHEHTWWTCAEAYALWIAYRDGAA